MATSWRPFMISTSTINSRIPPLLISTSFTVDSYKVYLTDLAHLWCEDADRRSILRRSLAEDTSIDPSEDSGQFQLFLEKIRLGLEGGKDVDILLRLGSHSSKEGPIDVKSLDIDLSIGLPKPLQPLTWSIKLVSRSQSDFATYFTVPLLHTQNARLRELDNLLGMLRDKDIVIQKLLAKLEAIGAELGQIFPGAAGKGGRKVSRKAVEERVKGLELFEQDQWYNSMKKTEDEEEHDVKTIIQSVFSHKSAKGLLASSAASPRGSEKWWEQLKDGAVHLSTRQIRGESTDTGSENVKTETAPADIDTTEEEDNDAHTDDFQVAVTPPPQQVSSPRDRTPHSHKSTRSQKMSYDATGDSDDHGGTSQSQPVTIRDSFPAPKSDGPTTSRKLGAIGRSKKASKTTTKSNSEQELERETEQAGRNTRSQRQDGTHDSETETEDEGVNDPPDPATTHNKSSPRPTTKDAKKKVTGNIGSKKHDVSSAPASPPTKGTPATEEPELPTRAAKSKLGRIGPKKSSKEGSADEEPRGRQDTKEEEEKPRETSEDRAQRKREELKRELEEKAKAPAKKKRRF